MIRNLLEKTSIDMKGTSQSRIAAPIMPTSPSDRHLTLLQGISQLRVARPHFTRKKPRSCLSFLLVLTSTECTWRSSIPLHISSPLLLTHSHTLTHVEGERLLTYTPAKHIDLTPNLRNSLTQRETDYLRTQFNL